MIEVQKFPVKLLKAPNISNDMSSRYWFLKFSNRKRGITVKEYLAMDAEMSIARFLLPLILKSLGEKTCSICEIMGITPIMARILSVALNWKASPVIIKPCVSIKAAL